MRGDKIIDRFSVDKFGRNDAATDSEAVWMASQAVTWQTSAATMYISSTDQTNDVGIEITISYIDANGAQKEVTANLNGTDARTFVSTGVTALAVNRAYLSGSDEALTGDVYISLTNTGTAGVPTDLTKVVGFIPAEDGQTMQAIYYVPNEVGGQAIDGFWLQGWLVHVNGNSANAKAQIQLRFQSPGGSARTYKSLGFQPGGAEPIPFFRAKFFPAGTKIWVQCLSLTSVTDVSAELYGQLKLAIT